MLTHHLRPLSSPLKPPPLTVYREEVTEAPLSETLTPVCVSTPFSLPSRNQGLFNDPDRLLLIGLILLLWDSAPLELILALWYIMM